MSEPTDDEFRDWKDLVESPGWTRLQAYVAKAWSQEAMDEHVIKAADLGDQDALSKLRQIIASKRSVALVMAYPATRIHTLKPFQGEPPEHIGRRGAL